VSRYLMVLWSGGGCVPPQLALAKRLLRAGHEVSVFAPRSLTETVRASGAIFEPYRRAPEHDAADPGLDLLRDWEVRGLAARKRMRDNVVYGTASGICDDLLALVEENRPDAIVTDYLLLGSYIAAEKAGLPLAALMHTIFTLPRPGIPPFGPGWKVARGRTGRLRDAVLRKYQMRFVNARTDDLNALRHSHSLAPVESIGELVSAADRLLFLTSPAFDYPGPVPANARWAGVVTDPDDPPPPPRPLAGDGPPNQQTAVLVSFSTTFQRQAAILERVIEALAELPVQAVVTCGPAITPSQLPAVPNVRIVAAAPHRELLPTTDLVITHGGHGTVSAALRHGVPALVIPMGRDQGEIAARVVWHGAGISTTMRTSTSEIRRLIRRALDESSLRVAARQLAARMATEDPDTAVRELESIANSARSTITDLSRESYELG
jgi:UDP:flavonoid glycosyltransferase YjiC (YdhE family)